MISNFLKTAWRNLRRNMLFSLIHILGLSIGLTCCLLILLYTKDELSFDRFQHKADRLFRVTCEVIDKTNGRDRKLGEAGAVQGPAFKAGIPEVEDFVRTYENNFVVRNGLEIFNEKGTWADANFFKIFSFPLLEGDTADVLSDPHNIVLTEDLAKKYFGETHVVGKRLELEINNKFESFVVSGVAKRSPENSSVKFDMLMPFSYYAALSENDHGYWHLLNYSTYLLLKTGSRPDAISAKMQEIYKKTAGDQIAGMVQTGSDKKFVWGLQPFLQMHLNSEIVSEGSIKDESNPIYSYILTGIAFFILIIACINFVNLTVAQSLRRSKEIGLRKVIGSTRARLIRQFLGESYMICFISFVVAALLAGLIMPVFNELANKRLSLVYLLDLPLSAAFTGLFLLTGFAAGFYPALVLSDFRPVDSLRNRVEVGGKNYLSKGLVVIQFALTTFLIIGTIIVYFQYRYLTRTDLGYNDNDLLVVNITGQEKRHKSLLNQFETQLANVPGVHRVAQRMTGRWGTSAKANGQDISIDLERVDESYLPTLEIPLTLGRNFSKAFPSDSNHAVVVNESFVKEAGWTDAIGKIVDQVDHKDRHLVVIGVVKDYHFASLKKKINAELFTLDPSIALGQFLIRVNPQNIRATVVAIERVYKKLDPGEPFAYQFVRENNLNSYAAEDRWRQIISYAAALAVIISGIGLFGLTILTIRRRTKEIGVRKVLGANVWQISGLVIRGFVWLVIFSFILAVPAAWLAAHSWLENFPYRIALTGWIFVLGPLLALLIAMLTISVQTISAASVNPVKSLRSE